MRWIGKWRGIAACAALVLVAFNSGPAPAAVIDVPIDQPTLQAAVAAAAVSVDVDNVITISNSPVLTSTTISIGNEFGATRQLVIKPAANLTRASIVNDNPVVPIFHMSISNYVTLQDLDILRNITNGDHLVILNSCEEILIQRCRIGSNFNTTGTAGWSNVIMFYPTEVTLRNNVIFANATGTFDYGINVSQMSDPDNSVRLYNNDVSDYKLYGIRIAASANGALVLLRNNVAVNHEDLVTEPFAYRTDVQVLNGPTVVTSHNVAFATAPFVQFGVGQDIAGTGSAFLNFAKGDAPASFVTVDWNMVFDANPDHYRLVNLGPLHDGPADYGMTVTNVFPDIEVIDDIEGDYRPGGVDLHTDRGADQLDPGTGASGVRPSWWTKIELTSYPNPFNPTTFLSFVTETREHVELRIYDSGGRLARTLVDRAMGPGTHEVRWDGRNDRGTGLASGVYFARLDVGDDVVTRKLVLVK
jgi:hypothetical protein